MDQNFDNGYYGAQPQKPFTEKNEPAPQPAEQPPYAFEPQKPLMQPAEQPRQESQPTPTQPSQPMEAQPYPPAQPYAPAHPTEPQSFNPVQQARTYEDGVFSAPVQPYRPSQPAPQPHQPVYPPAGNAYPSYPVYPNAPQRPQMPPKNAQPPVNGNPYAAPAANPYPGYSVPAAEKKPKSNKAMIIIIVVLAVMLAASLAGILAFVINKASTETPANSNNFIEKLVPQETTPNFVIPSPQTPETTSPVHEESDYSSRIDKDYKGLPLASKPADADTNKNYTAETAFKAVSDSVVGVQCFSGDNKLVADSQGSGIIISEDGYVITNAHVIGNSNKAYSIDIITSDGKEYKAGVVGFDVRTDLALLKIDNASKLKAASFCDSKDVNVGDDLIIVGNPGGLNYQNTMTKGIVSALDRKASTKNIVEYIQTDAAINPGNSGGPAVNMYGQVIGVASAKIAADKYEGMGFCIPSSTVKSIIDELMKNGYVSGRVKIGISGMAVTYTEAVAYNIPYGIMVQEKDSNGPCGKIDLQENDVITAADGTKVTNFSEIYSVLEKHKEGDKIKLSYYRPSDGSEHEEEITLQADTN